MVAGYGLRGLSVAASLLAAAYLVAGLLSLYNWAASLTGAPAIAEAFARPSLGDALVLLAVGALALPAPLMLRRGEPVKALASVFVASILATAALAVEVLAQLAGMADALLAGEEPEPFNPLNAQILLGAPMTVLLALTARPMRRREELERLIAKAASTP